jgi:putative transposase
MSDVRRLQKSDKFFFVTVNLLRHVPDLSAQDFPFLIQAIEDSRQRHHFLFCGYVLMPDHWHALIWPPFPITISGVVKDVKYVSCRKLNRSRQGNGSIWQHQFWDRFVRDKQELRLRLDYITILCERAFCAVQKIGLGRATTILLWIPN